MLDKEAKSLVGGIESSFGQFMSAIDTKLVIFDAKKKEIEAMQARMAEFTKQANEKVLFNVGGKKFATTKSTLLKQETFFSGFLESDVLPDEKGYYFIDRTPKYFGMVMSFLRDGDLDLRGKSKDEIMMIKKEFDFYLIDITQFTEIALLTWILGDVPQGLLLTSDRKMVIRHGGKKDHPYCFGSTGWASGIHIFNIQIDIVDLSAAEDEFSVYIGVAPHSLKTMPIKSGSWISMASGKFYSIHIAYPNRLTAAHEISCPPSTVIELALHCDTGVLTFSYTGNDQTSRATCITVPKREMLYPCVQLIGLSHSARFV